MTRWRERWYGSDPQRGSAIVTEAGNLVCYLGGDKETHRLTTAIVAAHNAALSPQTLPASKCCACAGTKVVSQGGHDTGCDACHVDDRSPPKSAMVECDPVAVMPDGWSEWIHPLPGYLMGCCDCGLVHEMQVAIGRDNDEGAALNEGEERAGAVVIFRMHRHTTDQ